MQRNVRPLITTPLNKASYLFINSESESVQGTNNNFSYSLDKLPQPKNIAFNFYVKEVFYPSNVHQLQSKHYNYNKIGFRVRENSTGNIMVTANFQIDEGTYDTSQLCTAVAAQINAYSTAQASSYGGDQYTVNYNQITNHISFTRLSTTLVLGQAYSIELLANDAFAKYQNVPGFGLAYVLGLSYNSTFGLPSSHTVPLNITICPNPPNLTPFQYFYISCTGLANMNLCSDVESTSSIIYRCPLSLSGVGRYSHLVIQEANPEYGQYYLPTLNNRLNFQLLDQYGNLFEMAENSAVDLTIKLVPIE
jgi:hypothetical protein